VSILSAATGKNEMNRQEHDFIKKFAADDPKHGYNVNRPHYVVTVEEAGQAYVDALQAAFG
jgi:hypothetical protein